MTERIALGVAYHGGGFHGWQRQKETRTVQATLEEALSRIADHQVVTRAAGRTDSGVHAMGQVVHFDTTALRSDKAWTEGVNRWLPTTWPLGGWRTLGPNSMPGFRRSPGRIVTFCL